MSSMIKTSIQKVIFKIRFMNRKWVETILYCDFFRQSRCNRSINRLFGYTHESPQNLTNLHVSIPYLKFYVRFVQLLLNNIWMNHIFIIELNCEVNPRKKSNSIYTNDISSLLHICDISHFCVKQNKYIKSMQTSGCDKINSVFNIFCSLAKRLEVCLYCCTGDISFASCLLNFFLFNMLASIKIVLL